MNKSFSLVAVLLTIITGLVVFGFWQYLIFGEKPTLVLINAQDPQAVVTLDPVTVGKSIGLNLQANSPTGVCSVSGELVTAPDGKSIAVFGYTAPKSGLLNKKGSVTQSLTVKPMGEASDLTEGEAKLKISASDCSLFGATTTTEFAAKIDNTPPRVSITSTQHYINQGGAAVVTYTVSDDANWSGVKVGPYKFTGFAKPGAAPNERFAFFVFSYELAPDTKIEVVASDAAGNTGTATLVPAKFFAKEFRHRELEITDDFINTKIMDILANTSSLKNQGDNLKNYLQVNRDLRKENNAFLASLAKNSEPRFLWKDAFAPLVAAVEANFADYRSYLYNGQKIDEQVHLGFDMAAFEHHPILAAGAGIVVFSDYLGIYGNTIVLDHGYGLTSLYGHLSSTDVKLGDMVSRGQKIANSGATGLAGGDHLHFSMLIGGVQTNPVEFWDQHWIEDNVYLRLDAKNFAGDGTN